MADEIKADAAKVVTDAKKVVKAEFTGTETKVDNAATTEVKRLKTELNAVLTKVANLEHIVHSAASNEVHGFIRTATERIAELKAHLRSLI